MQAENSDVSRPMVVVAVAVTTCPTVTPTGSVRLIGAVPAPEPVITLVRPRYVRPSPLVPSQLGFEKNSIAIEVSGVLAIEPTITVDPPPLCTEVRTGKFWRSLAPVSRSRPSFAVTPFPPRSMPRLVFA